MISIIISKYHPFLIENLEENIKYTIGVPFEIIVIENGKGEMGLCEVYNIGAQKARYEILCFSHEDVEIQTMNWGSVVIDLFSQHKKLGLLGVAGSAYKPLSPSGWWYENAKPNVFLTNYIQCNKTRSRTDLFLNNPFNENLSAVACVDGFWFCTPKRIALAIKFDDSVFKGFHCYDIDYSLSVSEQFSVGVCFDILIRHYSEGTLNREWVLDTLKLTNKWKKTLPLYSIHFNEMIREEETAAFNYFLKQMLLLSFPLTKIFILPWSMKLIFLIGVKRFLKLMIKLVLDVYAKYKLSLLKKFGNMKKHFLL
jgi:hypothetical protein